MQVDELRQRVGAGEIDTVVVAFNDHYGRLMGKRFDAGFFLDSCLDDGTHGCDYLLTVDMEMEPVEGYVFANWDKGYGDVHLVPDLDTLRPVGWAPGSALVLCDIVDDRTHQRASVAPRSVLRTQVEALAAEGYTAMAASELEFYLYRNSYRSAYAKGYTDLESAGWYVEDYHLLQGARVEDYVGAARRAMAASEIPIESSKGEAAIGQHELNVRYADVLTMADRHAVLKHGLKELAESQGVSVTFMAKPDADQPGNSCHIHLSLWVDGVNAFAEPSGSGGEGGRGAGRSDLFRWFLGGWMRHAADLMVFYAPTVNSYKRYQAQSWAPTRVAWSTDNRTVGFRVVGTGSSLRIENRIPGADVNPHLAYAATLASGLDGIRNRIEPPAEFRGDGYGSDGDSARPLLSVPTSLEEAAGRLAASSEAERLLGREVVDHYLTHCRTEIEAARVAVTDWEKRRYFERI